MKDSGNPKIPKTVDEVVNRLLIEMSSQEREGISILTEEELAPIQYTLGVNIWDTLKELSVDRELMEDCIARSSDKDLDEVEAAKLIVKELWTRLKETQR